MTCLDTLIKFTYVTDLDAETNVHSESKFRATIQVSVRGQVSLTLNAGLDQHSYWSQINPTAKAGLEQHCKSHEAANTQLQLAGPTET